MQRIGVAQIVHSLEVGGMERVASHLALNLSERYRPLVVCLTVRGDFASLLDDAGVEVVALDKRPGKDLGLPRRLARVLRERNVQVVHAHNSGPLFTGTLAGKLAGAKLTLVTDHSRRFPERPTVVAAEFVLSRLIDEIVSVSDDNKDDLIAKLHWPRKKISVIANGVQRVPDVPEAERAVLRAEFGLPAAEPVCLTVARLEPQKNLAVLVDAVHLLDQRGVPGRFVIVGEGSQRPILEALIAQHGLADRVVLAGWRLDTLKLYGIADLMALSSDWEGLPMSILEAMSAALPVVSPSVGDVPKAVGHDLTGLLVPPRDPEKLADALAALLTDPARRVAMGAAGEQVWRAQYSVEHMVRRYEALYERYV